MISTDLIGFVYIYTALLSVRALSTCTSREKSFVGVLELPCPPEMGNCSWFQLKKDNFVPVSPKFISRDNHNNLILLSNDRESYGQFNATSSFSNISTCYEVCPFESRCDNCSDIVVSKQINRGNMNICSGNSFNITLIAPPNIHKIFGATLRRNNFACTSPDSNCSCIATGDVRAREVTYSCREKFSDITMAVEFYGHNHYTCGDKNLEWCTPRVNLVIVNCSDSRNDTTTPVVENTLSSTISSTMLPTPDGATPAATPTSPTKTNKDNLSDVAIGGIIGGIVGGIVLIIIIIIIIIVIVSQMDNKNTNPKVQKEFRMEDYTKEPRKL